MLFPSRRERPSQHSREPFLRGPERRPFTAGSGINGRWVVLLVAGIAAMAVLAWYMEKRQSRVPTPTRHVIALIHAAAPATAAVESVAP